MGEFVIDRRIYVRLDKDGWVINRAVFDGPMPADWEDASEWVESAVPMGSRWNGSEFEPPVDKLTPINPNSGLAFERG